MFGDSYYLLMPTRWNATAKQGEETMTSPTIIIDRDTCSMVLDNEEMSELDRVKMCIDIISSAVEDALGEDSDVIVVREYRTTGRRGTAEGYEQLLERVLVDNVDSLRARVFG